MALSQDAWSILRGGIGGTHAQHADGKPVAYAARAKLTSETQTPQDPAEVEVVLLNEIGSETGRIRGDAIIELRRGAATVLIVSDEIEPDEGPTVHTRGASTPTDDSASAEPA